MLLQIFKLKKWLRIDQIISRKKMENFEFAMNICLVSSIH